jgi:cold shock protein
MESFYRVDDLAFRASHMEPRSARALHPIDHVETDFPRRVPFLDSQIGQAQECAAGHFGRPVREQNMATGTVKWFNDAKGFGFIEPESGGEDIFAHFSAVQMEGFRTLKQGEQVQYELVQGPKGQMAQNIVPTALRQGENAESPLLGDRSAHP